MHSDYRSKSRKANSDKSKSFSTGDYETKSTSVFDYILRALYKIAYRGHLVANYFLRSETQGAYVAIWHEGQILLIRNSYKSTYTIPCGGIDRGETPVEAASRELFEEVGLDFSTEAFSQVFETINHTEFKKDHIFLFEVNLEALPIPQPDGREVIWAGFRTLEDALKISLFPPVRDYLLQKRMLIEETDYL
jgi:8-oxo-dGTP diphosphatase